MSEISLLKAVNLALEHELANDSSVVVFGEDVGLNGGVFRATENLQAKFGQARVFDTPIAESLIAGLAAGMSTQGLRPVAEFQFMGFIYPAMEQIICHIARMRNRTRGRITCPLVLRAPFTGGIKAPEHHSESTEALFAHIAGLRVVVPSSPQFAYSLLRQSIQSEDPVIFLEPKKIYHAIKESIDIKKSIAIDKCNIIRKGSDLTIISWGSMLLSAMSALKEIEKNQSISITLIDLVSIKPIDMKTIIASVQCTGRCLIIHEAARSCGVGAEISARINEQAFDCLLAPITRLTGYDTIMPLAKLEDFYLPSVNDIILAIKKIMEY